jgi:UPF0716 protein FxsA
MTLLFFLILIPIVEIYLFIEIGTMIGSIPTILSIFATAIVGSFLLKKQGRETIENLKRNMETMKPPIKEVFDGGCLILSGILLLTPGFFTDFIGFCLLIPSVRDFLRTKTTHKINTISGMHVHSKDDFYDYKDYSNLDSSNSNEKNSTIDGDYTEIKD